MQAWGGGFRFAAIGGSEKETDDGPDDDRRPQLARYFFEGVTREQVVGVLEVARHAAQRK